ncbi:hypothetical protein BV902_01030 [Sphingobacterium sp. B29]|uniref:AAA family ATPase n=1 Tax=Sphingobacterium sp. B29 TaxID=1933220 RepID=UPI000958049E|nr:ATP-binding protein [Sphingobacterium sp. B29]APU95084.1 hypothetical protein BV902_01030 [Sphingobacterium sp. B29]
MDCKIRKLEIDQLWGQYNVLWELNEDVNILSGINGSGKSTILDCLAASFVNKDSKEFLTDRMKQIRIFSNDGMIFHYEEFRQSISKLRFLAGEDGKNAELYRDILKDIEENELLKREKITSVKFNFLNQNGISKFKGKVNIDVISTFDTAITIEEETFNEKVRTDLDRELYFLQKKYLDYQLNLAKGFQEILKDNRENIQKSYDEMYSSLNLFKSYVKDFFYGKKLDEEKNDISFVLISNNKKLDIYSLSSGEKQLLLILLVFLLQDRKPSVVFLDEPEISLHFDWQKRLIEVMRSLNPNAQLIIATHSPAMVMNGWVDKIVNIDDIKTLGNKNNTTNELTD